MIDDKEPATRGDVRESVGELAAAVKIGFDNTATKEDVTNLKDDVSKLKKGQVSLKQGQKRILSIVESIDEHFKEHKELPDKVEKLEADVFKIKTRFG